MIVLWRIHRVLPNGGHSKSSETEHKQTEMTLVLSEKSVNIAGLLHSKESLCADMLSKQQAFFYTNLHTSFAAGARLSLFFLSPDHYLTVEILH